MRAGACSGCRPGGTGWPGGVQRLGIDWHLVTARPGPLPRTIDHSRPGKPFALAALVGDASFLMLVTTH